MHASVGMYIMHVHVASCDYSFCVVQVHWELVQFGEYDASQSCHFKDLLEVASRSRGAPKVLHLWFLVPR